MVLHWYTYLLRGILSTKKMRFVDKKRLEEVFGQQMVKPIVPFTLLFDIENVF